MRPDVNRESVPRFSTLGTQIIMDSELKYNIDYPDIESVVNVLNQQEEIIRTQRRELEKLRHKDQVIGDFVRSIAKGLEEAQP
jgi:hypothetical protein